MVLVNLALTVLALLVARIIQIGCYNLLFHKLAGFPGPKLGCATRYRKAYIECILQKSWHTELARLHAIYGPVVRVAPDELHFSSASAYHDIYNNKNRWDKERTLYHSFGEDESSFGFLTYKEAKQRKDVLSRSFSSLAIRDAQGLVQDRIDGLCRAFAQQYSQGQSCNLTRAFRACTVDVITYFCFGKDVEAVTAPDFEAPILVSMDATARLSLTFKYSNLVKNMVLKSPPTLARKISPETRGLLDLQDMIRNQIRHLTNNREAALDLLPHTQTIYHHLLDEKLFADGITPSPKSLLEEGQALLFGGTDTVGNSLLYATFYLAKNAELAAKLKDELRNTAVDNPPSIKQLETLPFLNACLKESLRMSCGVVAGLPRIVPQQGARIDGHDVPAEAVVSVGSSFVHYNPEIFGEPYRFKPERWLENPDLDQFLIAFSRGPRSCLGVNLAWMEMRLLLACVFLRFDLALDPSSPDELEFVDTFLPHFICERVRMVMKPIV